MKVRKVLIGFIGIYVFTALCLARAQEGPGPEGFGSPKGHPGERIQEIFNQLNLTDTQKKQLEDNKRQHRAQMQRVHQAMKVAREAMKAELMKPQLDITKLTALHNQIKALQSQMEDNMFASILAVRTILTPEQFGKFINLMHHRPQQRAPERGLVDEK